MRSDRTDCTVGQSAVSFIPEPQIYNLSVVQLSGTALPNMHKALGLILGTTKKKEKEITKIKKKQTFGVGDLAQW